MRPTRKAPRWSPPPEIVTLRCAVDGCTATLKADARHVENLTAAGGWRCQSCRVAAKLREADR